jgi:hypothetical protein
VSWTIRLYVIEFLLHHIPARIRFHADQYPGGTEYQHRPEVVFRGPNHSGSMNSGLGRGLSICGDGPSRDNGAGGSDMARLIYSAIASLDGYVEDEQGRFDWAAPDDEVLAAVNDLERPIGTYLYGRRMYETMAYWETASTGADQSAGGRDFAELWRVAEKVVYSPDASDADHHKGTDRARVRARCGSAAQGDVGIRHHGWWRGARRPGHQRGPRRRVPLVPQPDPRRWRQTRIAGQGARSASAAG